MDLDLAWLSTFVNAVLHIYRIFYRISHSCYLRTMATISPSQVRLKDGTLVTLRGATEEDTAAVTKAVTAYVAENDGQVWEPGEFKKTEAEEREWIRGMIASPVEILILAEFDGQIVGNIDFHGGDRKRLAHHGEFGLGILPEWRSRGLGSALLGHMIEWVKTLPQIEKIKLRVLASNQRAIGLYKKFGFEEEGRIRREYKFSDGTYVDSISMGKFLE
jgi:RimJ/RimL family protein N-acetyltransferase